MIALLLNPPTFLLLAAFGGLLIALTAAPLGVFMVWQKQSYFGATLAHSALLGVSFGLFMSLNLTLSVILVSIAVAISIHIMAEKTQLSMDTLLGILAHGSLALGLVLLSLQETIQIDIMSYLFGDILSITKTDLLLISILSGLVVVFFGYYWQDLLNITLNSELSQIESIPVKRIQLYYTLLLALMIAISMKVVGVLLITSLLIIPAATARKFSQSPEQMLWFSLLLGVLSIVFGLMGSFAFDLPTGPSIVLVSSLFFLLSLLKTQKA